MLQSDLDSLCGWSHSSSLRFNSNKTFVVHYHPPRSSPLTFDYFLDGYPIDCMDTCRDLGVIFSSSLSWSPQVKFVLTKAYGVLWTLKRVFPCSTTPTVVKKKLYLSLVIPIITYCCPVWRPSLIKDITALEQLQVRATKHILNNFSDDYKSRLLRLELLPLMYRLELVEIMFFISQFQLRNPRFDVMDYFAFSSSGTRSGTYHKLVHSSFVPLSAKHTFFHRFPRLCNSLPPIDLSKSTDLIKRSTTKFFIHKFNHLFNSNNHHTFHTVCPCSACSVYPVSLPFLPGCQG